MGLPTLEGRQRPDIHQAGGDSQTPVNLLEEDWFGNQGERKGWLFLGFSYQTWLFTSFSTSYIRANKI